jgi:N5-(carboxyethyl)ornithine synthase
MKTIGFVISEKENERRRALVPDDLSFVRNTRYLYFEKGYGNVLGFTDGDYETRGANIATSGECYKKDIVCNPKFPSIAERKKFSSGQTLFGWIHAVQNRENVDFLVSRKMTAIAWEEMYEGSIHSFWRNNEIAGEAGVLHAVSLVGRILPEQASAAEIGHGNAGVGALRMLTRLGVTSRVFHHTEIEQLKQSLPHIDILVNCVKWDPLFEGRILHREDLKRFKKGSLIIDISCNRGMEIETTVPTSFDDPVYEVDGIIHYAVDHVPAKFWISASHAISAEVKRYLDDLIEGNNNPVLRRATVIDRGRIIDNAITAFQKRLNPVL